MSSQEFYSNDVVYRFDKHKRIVHGVVLNSYEDTIDTDERNALQKGQIRVLWMTNSRELVWRQKKVRLLSRNIVPGDIVRRMIHGKEAQRGYCKETKQLVTVQIVGTDKVVEGVCGNRLNPVTPFDLNSVVSVGEKVGQIEGVDQLVTMRSKCGSLVQFLNSVNHEIEDYWLRKRNRCYLDMFYPGQEVVCTPHSLQQPHWIVKTKAMKRNMQSRQRFTVQKVEPSAIVVSWFDSPSHDSSNYSDLTQNEIKIMKYLGPLEHDYLDLGQRKFLKLNSSDNLIRKRDWMHKQSVLHRSEFVKVVHNKTTGKKSNLKNVHYRNSTILPQGLNNETDDDWSTEDAEDVSDNESSSGTSVHSNSKNDNYNYPPKASDLVVGHTVPVEVLCFESKTTVVWQDGTEEKDIPSTELVFSFSLDDHEFFSGEWVLMANDKDNTGKYGVVQVVNHLERTATVKWFKNLLNPQPIVDSTTEISVYDLKKHSKFAFRPGSNVKNKLGDFQGKFGCVRDSCPEGYVIVEWHTGQVENCWPQTIELLFDSGHFVYSDDDDEPSSIVSWETESVETVAGDITDETTLQNMAARLDFIRNRIVYLKEAFKNHNVKESFAYLRDLLMVYDNSSYLDKLLDTSFFSPKSRHYQALIAQVREKAKFWGVEFRGRLFSFDGSQTTTSKAKLAEKENINKVVKLEHRINAQLENVAQQSKDAAGEPSTPLTPESDSPSENLCIELLSMLKIRMDLAYAEIISRIGGPQALTVLTKASETSLASTVAAPSIPTTPEIVQLPPVFDPVLEISDLDTYTMLDSAPVNHHFYANKFEPNDKQKFFKAVQKEFKLLKDSLPPGVWIRSYSNRLDLLSVMIKGPDKTPYENGLFVFEIQLSSDYPRSPPLCHYISYSSERLNPNLYVEGKVCVSLLGTWMGQGTEVWGPESTLLQLIVSIQGLILVSEPYYNEAGYERELEGKEGYENSRLYNELVVLKMVQSMTEMIRSPPEVFKKEVNEHFLSVGLKMCERLRKFVDNSDPSKPEFPLLPVSKGLKISLGTSLDQFEDVLKSIDSNK